MFFQDLTQTFKAAAQPDKAQWMQAYMRDQFPFLGIPKPQRSELLKQVLARHQTALPWFETAQTLFDMPEREYQYAAMEFLYLQRANWDERLPELVEAWTKAQAWWDITDVLAPKILGHYFKQHPQERDPWTQRWMQSEHFWLQRLCVIYQLNYKEKTDLAFLSKTILALLGSKEFFINKAIGWALRQHARVNPEWVKAFVLQHPLAALSKREALKHLS